MSGSRNKVQADLERLAPTLEEGEALHVVPLFGREHDVHGFDCWCHPEPDCGIIIHHVFH